MGARTIDGQEAQGATALPPDEVVRQSFALAVQAHDRGELFEAEQLYRAILSFRHNHADALHGMGVLAHQVGRHELAVEWIGLALDQRRDATFHNNRALVLLKLGRAHEAMSEALKALELRPFYPQAYNALGNIQDRLGLKEEATASYRRALDINPNFVDAISNLGKVLKDRGETEEAKLSLEKALKLNPACVEAANNLGALLRERGEGVKALDLLNGALERRPDFVQAYVNRALVWLAEAEIQQAEADFRAALALNPDCVPAHCGLGAVCLKTERDAEALEHYETALSIDENNSEALEGACAGSLRLNRFDRAKAYLDRATGKQKPLEQADAFNHFGVNLVEREVLEAAIKCFDHALSLDPDHEYARNNRAHTLMRKGEPVDAMRGFDEVLEGNPRHAVALSNKLLSMHYVDQVSNAEILEAARRFGALHDQPLSAERARRERSLDPDRRLRVGYVSGDFNAHPVAIFLTRVLQAHDKSKFEIFCYSNQAKEDGYTLELKGCADHWREIAGVANDEAAAMIADDQIDILVDLAGHTAKNRILLFAKKPAPLQAEWLGYPGTSGLPSMDYILLDSVSAPPGHDAYYVEKIARLPEGRFCYNPSRFDLPVAPPPLLQRGSVTFGSFNNVAKINESVIALWSRLLREVSGSRLVLKWKSLSTESVRAGMRAAFARHGVLGDRLELRPASSHYLALREYGDVDIALDPFPFGGATTTCDALWMGVPVLTLPGERLASRQTLAFLHFMGHGELAAASPDDFVSRAAALAADPARLMELRQSLRAALLNAPFSDARKFTRGVEQAYRAMWRRHVAGEKPAPLDIPEDATGDASLGPDRKFACPP